MDDEQSKFANKLNIIDKGIKSIKKKLFLSNIGWEKALNNYFPGFDLTARDSYFTILVEVFTNHFLIEYTYYTNHAKWTEHKIMGFKPGNKYQIIRGCHNF